MNPTIYSIGIITTAISLLWSSVPESSFNPQAAAVYCPVLTSAVTSAVEKGMTPQQVIELVGAQPKDFNRGELSGHVSLQAWWVDQYGGLLDVQFRNNRATEIYVSLPQLDI
jgi:hypothetical protein